VYHTITHGMGFLDTYLAGQIRLALSLKGPGHFTQFKTLFWNYLLGNYQYVAEVPFRGTGAEADSHRTTLYTTFFPTRRGRNQRRNRLKYFVIQKLANGDVRIAGTFWHFLQARLLPQRSRLQTQAEVACVHRVRKAGDLLPARAVDWHGGGIGLRRLIVVDTFASPHHIWDMVQESDR
jgi:hypothetical protein